MRVLRTFLISALAFLCVWALLVWMMPVVFRCWMARSSASEPLAAMHRLYGIDDCSIGEGFKRYAQGVLVTGMSRDEVLSALKYYDYYETRLQEPPLADTGEILIVYFKWAGNGRRESHPWDLGPDSGVGLLFSGFSDGGLRRGTVMSYSDPIRISFPP